MRHIIEETPDSSSKVDDMRRFNLLKHAATGLQTSQITVFWAQEDELLV